MLLSVFSQGDKGTSWYIIWKGSVNVVTHGKVSSPSRPPATVPWSVSALCFRSSWMLLLRVPGLLLPQTCLSLSQQGLVGGWAVTESWLQGLVTTLHEGDDFGQLALVNDAPRAATIILRENNCHFLRVDKQDFNRIIKVPWGWGR